MTLLNIFEENNSKSNPVYKLMKAYIFFYNQPAQRLVMKIHFTVGELNGVGSKSDLRHITQNKCLDKHFGLCRSDPDQTVKTAQAGCR